MPPKAKTAGPQLRIKSTDRVCITGQPGTGKSTLVAYLASLFPEDQLLIIDPLEQYNSFPPECRFVPPDRNPAQEMDAIARQVMARGNMVLFIEEAQKYLPESHRIGDNTMALLNRGRNYGIGVFASTQRIQNLQKSFFDLCQVVIFFRPGFQSRAYIRHMVTPEACKVINSLPNFHFVHYNLATEDWAVSRLQFPRGQKLADDGGVPQGTRMVTEETHPADA